MSDAACGDVTSAFSSIKDVDVRREFDGSALKAGYSRFTQLSA
jgi:hypothetical protein